MPGGDTTDVIAATVGEFTQILLSKFPDKAEQIKQVAEEYMERREIRNNLLFKVALLGRTL